MTPSDAWRHLAPLVSPVPSAPEGMSAEAWAAAVDLASGHGLSPLLYHSLRARDRLGLAPGGLADRLRDAHTEAVARHDVLARAALDGVSALANRIPTVILKGPALAHTVYPSPHLRHYDDIDLLVHRANLDRARDILLDRGFQEAMPGARSHLPPMARITDDGHQLWFEVHWSIAIRGRLPEPREPRLWETVRPAEIWGREFLILAPEVMALHAANQCFYALTTGTLHLRHLVDTAYLLRSQPFDVAALRELADECGGGSLVAAVAALSGGDERLPVSPRVRRALGLLENQQDTLLGAGAPWTSRFGLWMALLLLLDRTEHRLSWSFGASRRSAKRMLGR